MRRSDAFAETQLAKTGKLVQENSFYSSMNNWYGELRQNKDKYERHSNFIERSLGVNPIYVHETCHFRDTNIIKKPKDLELFDNRNLKNPCMKHLRRSTGDLKPLKVQQRINALDELMIKGSNKFDTEIDYIRSIPETERYIIKNMEGENKPDQSPEGYTF